MDAMNASCKATATAYLVGRWAKYSARLPDLKKPYIGSIEWLYRVMNYATQTTLLPGVALPQEPLRGFWATVIVGALFEQLSPAETFFFAEHLGRHICRRIIDWVSSITSQPILY